MEIRTNEKEKLFSGWIFSQIFYDCQLCVLVNDQNEPSSHIKKELERLGVERFCKLWDNPKRALISELKLVGN